MVLKVFYKKQKPKVIQYRKYDNFFIFDSISLPQDIEILDSHPVVPVLPRGEKVPL